MAEEGHHQATALPGVSRETSERLGAFIELFERWSARTNLVARSTRADVLGRHIGDSLQLACLAPGPRHWIDLGSGAGFPGLIVAIVLAEGGEGWVDLIESNHKKAAFLRSAIAATDARAAVHPVRIEAAAMTLRHCDAVSSRALACLPKLLVLAAPWLAGEPKREAWFHKGRDYRSELAEARGSWRFDLIEHRSSIEPDSVILQIRNLERR